MDPIEQLELNSRFYRHIHTEKREPTWRGVQVIKMPTDLLLYEQVIWENKPDVIVEIGTCFGGSALFFQDALDRVGHGGSVITIDIRDRVKEHDPRINYLLGDSKSDEIIGQVKAMTAGKAVMVVVDGYHGRRQVKWELHKYTDIVTSGQYMVVEDCYSKEGKLYQPGEARDWFLGTRRGRLFEQTNLDRQYLIGFCVGGWLRRK